jgi:hypothetical protein
VSLDHHAGAQALERVRGRDAAHAHVVLAFHFVARMHEPFGQLAVVGEQQQAFGVVVETSDGVDVLLHLGQQHEDRVAVFGIVARGHVAAGLEEHDVAPPAGDVDSLAVHTDVVMAGVGLGAQLEHRLAVHRDASLRDESFRGAS